MAKNRSVIKFSGTHFGLTHVDSRTYGPHSRAPRGTYKPATLNDKMRESGKIQVAANVYAKLINDQINLFRENFKGGQFWQNLLSQLRSHYKQTGAWEPVNLRGMEIDKQYQLSRLLKGGFTHSATIKEDGLSVIIRFYAPPAFRSKQINGFKLQLFVVYVNHTELTSVTDLLISEIFDFESVIRQNIKINFPSSNA